MRAIAIEESWVEDYHEEMQGNELDDGRGDMGFDREYYEGVEDSHLQPTATSSLLPPHVKAACIAYH